MSRLYDTALRKDGMYPAADRIKNAKINFDRKTSDALCSSFNTYPPLLPSQHVPPSAPLSTRTPLCSSLNKYPPLLLSQHVPPLLLFQPVTPSPPPPQPPHPTSLVCDGIST